MKKYWICIIGPIEETELPDGADYPPRFAAIESIQKMTDISYGNFFCSSGWCDKAEYDKVMEVKNIQYKKYEIPHRSSAQNRQAV